MSTSSKRQSRALALLAVGLVTATAFAQGTAMPEATAAVGPSFAQTAKYWLLGIAILQTLIILAMNSILKVLSTPGGPWTKLLGGKGSRVLVLLPLLLAAGQAARAQTYPGPDNTIANDGLIWVLALVNLLLFVVILVQLNLLRQLTGILVDKPAEVVPEPVMVKGPSFSARLMQRLTRQVPVKEEHDILLDHNYDGIRELDNSLPPWWLWLFYATIVWAVVYWVGLNVFKVWPDQATEYRQEMAQAKIDVDAYLAKQSDQVDENTVKVNLDPGVIANGQAIFENNCVPCHGAQLQGMEGLGPNLTDAYWKHGGGIHNVFHTITYGVPEKGMISWKAQLKPTEIAAVANFVLSKQGSNPPNAKAPEGALWTGEEASPDSTAKQPPTDTLRTVAAKP